MARSSVQWDAVHFYLHGMRRVAWKPADEQDEPVFVGRFNIGAVSLHLPMIICKGESRRARISMKFWIII